MKRLSILFLLITSLIFTACDTAKPKDDPEINVKLTVSDLTDEDYESVGTKGLENPTKDDFKNIKFTLDVTHSNNITNRNVVIPNIQKAINKYDKNRYWFGQTFKQDNENENFAKYSDTMVLYSKGLDNKDIKEIFKSAVVKISWTDKDNGGEKEVNLSDIIQFKKSPTLASHS